jgi:hypothetical protein
MIHSKKILLVALLGTATGIGSFASTSMAFDQRSSFAACVDATASGKLLGGTNISTTNSVILDCAVTDTASLPHASMATINLYYDDLTTTASVSASRCIAYQNIAGGACGDSVSSSFSGTGTSFLTLPNTPASFAANWNWGHFAFLSVILPPQSASGASGVKGFWMSN